MIRRTQGLLNALSRVMDFMLIVISYLLATLIRFNFLDGVSVSMLGLWELPYISVVALYALSTCFLYYCFGLYRSMRINSFRRDFLLVPLANAITSLAFIAFLYVTRVSDFSRIAIALCFGFATVLVLLKRGVVRLLMRHLRKKGYNLRHVLLVGTGPLAQEYADSIAANPQFGFYIDGAVAVKDTQNDSDFRKGQVSMSIAGNLDDLERLLASDSVDAVVIALEIDEVDKLPVVISQCEQAGTRSYIVPFFNSYTSPKLDVEYVGNVKLLNTRQLPLDDPFAATFKRLFDLVVSLVMLAILGIPMLLVALLVKLTSRGPILFRQERVGWGGHPFVMYKFRSMRVNDRSDSAWSTADDDRRTRLGSFIRKVSIDELPQLFNVIKGDMSLVGPRPEIPHFVDQFADSIPLYMVKHQIKPGITGWAQIYGWRGDTSIAKRIKLDIWYMENWSFDLDIRIMLKTLFRVKNYEKLPQNPKVV